MNSIIFWGMAPCGFSKDRRFGGTYRLHLQGEKNQRTRNVSNNYQLIHGAKKHS
jgi:hypothetical protein